MNTGHLLFLIPLLFGYSVRIEWIVKKKLQEQESFILYNIWTYLIRPCVFQVHKCIFRNAVMFVKTTLKCPKQMKQFKKKMFRSSYIILHFQVGNGKQCRDSPRSMLFAYLIIFVFGNLSVNILAKLWWCLQLVWLLFVRYQILILTLSTNIVVPLIVFIVNNCSVWFKEKKNMKQYRYIWFLIWPSQFLINIL